MADIIHFPGFSQKAPEQERLNAHEAPLVRRYMQEVDLSAQAAYPHAVRMPVAATIEYGPQPIAAEEAAQTAPISNVMPIANHPRYEYAAAGENDPAMAALARKAIDTVHNPLTSGEADAQEAA